MFLHFWTPMDAEVTGFQIKKGRTINYVAFIIQALMLIAAILTFYGDIHTDKPVYKFVSTLAISAFISGITNYWAVYVALGKACFCRCNNKTSRMQQLIEYVCSNVLYSSTNLSAYLLNLNFHLRESSTFFDTPEFDSILDESLSEFMSTEAGVAISSYGIDKSEFVEPCRESAHEICDLHIDQVIDNVMKLPHMQPEAISADLDRLVAGKIVTLDEETANQGTEEMMGSDIHWIIVYGVILGALFSTIHHIVFYYWVFPNHKK